ncbi:probable cadmium-transporting ATPase [Hydractinia symbiolongicarpus]|uniref:probable cadmium-transporting ATPase n=1 Tax=Hydractinia symbiolongicarpus TaxID=13093 RepID=UPI00254D4BDD|nr:probable cadmium-transporting ATPase [Hydractinia symbiolongicarpus]
MDEYLLEKKNIPNYSRRGDIHILKLRVQNICCGKEANLIKSNLADLDGITSVAVNIIGRTATISHNIDIISVSDIIDRLNSLHLGISLIEKGQVIDNDDKHAKYLVLAKIFNVVLMTLLFIAVLVAHVKNYSFEKWIAIPIFILGGLPMLWKAFIDFRRKVFASVNLLMLIAGCGTIALQHWLDGSIIMYVFTIAESLENLCRYKVEKDIAGLMLSTPETAVLAESNESVPVEDVTIGTDILICSGERIPLDGEVTKGKAAVDESSITGESIPVMKVIGNLVFSGTIIQSGYLKVKTTSDYSTSTVARVAELVEEAQTRTSRTEEILNKFAKYYTPCILVTSFFVFIIPFILYKTKDDFTKDDLSVWSVRSIIILVVACPCSLIMATPIPMICGITNAAKIGALIRGGAILEKLAKVNTVVFDKTGTLTEGRFQVVKEIAAKDGRRNEAVAFAAALETKSSHPLAASIVNHYSGCITDKIDELGSTVGLPDVTGFKNESGMGLSGIINGNKVFVGNTALMQKHNVIVDVESKSCFEEWSLDGFTVIFVAIEQELSLVLGLADKCRQSAPLTVHTLLSKDIECALLTGDSQGPAEMIKKKVGLSTCKFNMKPNDKYDWITEKRKTNKKSVIAMIGDGVNDCPSLAAADVGIAIGPSATALAVQSADISLMTDNLTKIPDLFLLSKHCRRIVFQNIFAGIFIKIVFVLAALVGNTALWVAILSDVIGLLFVTLNGLRPLYWKPRQMDVTWSVYGNDESIMTSSVFVRIPME